MRIAAFTCVYNQERFIGPAIQQLQPYVDHHLVHLSARPWIGENELPDRTEALIRQHFPQVELRKEIWPDETCQRNQGLGRLREYDWVWIVDADEYYTAHDIECILHILEENKAAVHLVKQQSYWKMPEYRWEPRDTWPPAILMDPRRSFFFLFRAPVQPLEECHFIAGVTMHHFNYIRTDAEMRSKLSHFSHQADIRPEWHDVWRTWEVDSAVNVFPYCGSARIAVYDPAPDEIVRRFTDWQEQLVRL